MSVDVVQAAVLSVTEYSAALGRAVRMVGAAVIEGEVQKVLARPNGMLYFDLTDGESLLACKMFSRGAARLQRRPRQGDLVQVQVDRPDWYAARGSLSLIVSGLRLAGEGELLRRRQELIARLAAEGLCDPARRRPLPRYPRAVGVIAGEGSDGMSDVVRALCDRWPAVHVVACASLVQGKAAPRQLIDALARLQQHPLVDVIVLARGGGSVQDLACFDDERLCRALFACDVPVVCAIGHTDNNPVCNHVAWPAFTPSRSAELVVPCARELRRGLANAGERLAIVPRLLAAAQERVEHGGGHLGGAQGLLARAREQWTREGELIGERVARRLERVQRDVQHQGALVAAHDFRPRGWLLAAGERGAPLRSAAEIAPGARIRLQLRDGAADAVVERIHLSDQRGTHA